MNIFYLIGVAVVIVVVAGFWDCIFEQALRRSVIGSMFPRVLG
jgi:hypothetical protein